MQTNRKGDWTTPKVLLICDDRLQVHDHDPNRDDDLADDAGGERQ